MFHIKIESDDAYGFQHVIVHGRTDAGCYNHHEALMEAMRNIKAGMYAGCSVYERMPLELTTDRDFAAKTKHAVAYLRFYRRKGPEFVKPIDRKMDEEFLAGPGVFA